MKNVVMQMITQLQYDRRYGKIPELDEKVLVKNTIVLLVVGPLGSGKTTLLNSLVQSNSELLGDVLVIVNDYGSVNVDAQRFDHSVVEIAHECVCCSSFDTLQQTLQDAKGTRDTILIEPTGVASPTRLVGLIGDIGMPLVTIGILDVKNLKENQALGLQDNAIVVAQVVVLTHMDQESAGIPVEPESIRNYRLFLNPTAPCVISLDGLLAEFVEAARSRAHKSSDRSSLEREQVPKHKHSHSHAHEGLELFQSEVIRPYPSTSIDLLRSVFGRMSLVRAKGRVGQTEFDVVFDQFTEHPAHPSSGEGVVVLIWSGHSPDISLLLEIGVPLYPKEDTSTRQMRYPKPGLLHAAGFEPLAHFEEADALYGRLYPIRNHLQLVSGHDSSWATDLLFNWRRVLESYLLWRLDMLQELTRDPRWGGARRAYFQFEVGLSICWHADRYHDDIPAELFEQIAKASVAQILVEGMCNLKNGNDNKPLAILTTATLEDIKRLWRFSREQQVKIEDFRLGLENLKAISPDPSWTGTLWSELEEILMPDTDDEP
jgi:G3E family GTPase